ncbi:acetoacetate--CoA ligase [Frankia sp. CNm7]|uniref:Acetoacetate--CoA ligase n=1 Tax=Frankia nepalensis TaxID=1836974 RepID=A0A937UQS4_9ACTN|nr:acetoacetate--CoA ligase [Frankia nepalensis]MBL7500854.1 acetoacetate--CoA ligase [Frankia nepalensis]MBL7509220.1 acetoacetate--CoA ligase [Frankia nepalensis]MBL7517320.1 acetoacetate--CoA ligase [Frankia nepalensis]MBL7627016.1 acetoacetate--CoA ligase [Frankia nepalensis]
MTAPAGPELLYDPHPDQVAKARVRGFLSWLAATGRADVSSWEDLRRWSVADLAGFWEAVWRYFDVKAHAPYTEVLADRVMPGARWFPGATLNYAEHCFGAPDDAATTAVLAYSQTRDPVELTFGELAEQVRRVREGLRRLGVGRGDRVAGYLPNCPEALIAFLATASLGAIWAGCAPEFGPQSVIDRFDQIGPKVLLAVAGYTYGAKQIDKRSELVEIRAALATVEHVVHVPYGPLVLDGTVDWSALAAPTDEQLSFEPVPFAHPLCVLFSSGTTGKPKAIVHGHGGLLLEHLKNHSFHWNLGPGDRLLWFTTTAWMMWNTLVSALLVRSAIVMIDGNPLYPDPREQWRLAQETGATLMGASPGYLMSCRKAGLRPAEEFGLSRLQQIGVAGSPFPPEGFRWVAEQFGGRVLLNVGSGGTDVCTGLVQASPLQPVWAGEMSGASLGVDARAFDEEGNDLVGEVGELVITAPMPSMPVGFWGDEDGGGLRAAYFAQYPGVFRFGDWCRFSTVGSCVITGRSDATLNRGGVRLGTGEFYRVLEDVTEIVDSVIVYLEDPAGGTGELILFVVPAAGVVVDEALRHRLAKEIRAALSPRHVPDTIVPVVAVPYSRTGKKLEVPVKRILRGAAPTDVASPGALLDPGALDAFAAYARERGTS